MLSQKQVTQKCAECNYTEFYVEDGHFYCKSCQTQDEVLWWIFCGLQFIFKNYPKFCVEFQNAIEQAHEIKVSTTIRTRKFRIKSDQSKSENDGWF